MSQKKVLLWNSYNSTQTARKVLEHRGNKTAITRIARGKSWEEHFVATHSRDNKGDSRGAALKRLKAVERKLRKQPQLRQDYYAFMSEYLELNHMKEVLPEEMQLELVYYLPHHAVIKEDSDTTKIRVVFDASCKSSTGISLNDCLKIGPPIQADLVDILLRLRQHQYAMSADITKICLQEVALQGQEEHPDASRAIANDFYVDDLLTGTQTPEDLKKLRQEITEMLSNAGFELRKWKSNCSGISDKVNNNSSTVEIGEPAKILGLLWDTTEDTFHYKLRLSEEKGTVTKRSILAQVAQIYDPLGLLRPIVVKAKIILHRLWQDSGGWDEKVTGETLRLWKQWRSQIHDIQTIAIPRRVAEQSAQIEMHGFCDASERAYGACLYLRNIKADDTYITRLLCAKSRIAPLKKVSLPRLELCGAVLLAHLTEKAMHALSITVHQIYYWSDSTITLSWIGGEPNKWNTFVANRVAEIHRITDKASWYHIKSEDNPADPLSRGISPNKLRSKKIWWEGPEFLQHESTLQAYDCRSNESHIPERRNVKSVVLASTNSVNPSIIQKFSSLTRLRRVVAYCLRFKSNSLKSTNRVGGSLTVLELEQAMTAVIKICQANEFSKELDILVKGAKVDLKSRLSTLHPFLDSSGIIRVGGRLHHAPLEYTQKHPIVLPKKNHLTDLIIRDAHYRNLHAGPQAVLAMLRNEFWPIAGKSEVRKILRNCIVCFRVKPANVT
ncbi:PREDICTED: uncharacterized protein LOC105448210 [Wasmannia auropunctata]|uniref:uncharacterized protein LOC105448210 n=1 Tax=Wasmannia auropunctata TaxID=64793 RepID=UPI0005ED5A86|nr:PREDICTED: uncharacterized protein LOC105448210 [Wasmannia auropunctata]